MSTANEVDVVVVGAGLAGLTAARTLARKGRSVAVLEARDRVGGRTLTKDVHGARLDVGAQWLDTTQHRMLALCEEFGLELFPTAHDGNAVLLHRDRRSAYAGTIPKLSPLTLLQIQAAITAADKLLAGRVDPAAPETARAADRLDRTSFADWLRRVAPGRQPREVVDVAVRTVFGAEADEFSALWAAAYAQAGGGLMRLVEIEDGAQELRFADGAQTVSNRLAEDLGLAVVTGAAVAEVDASGDRVRVQTADGRTWSCRQVVVAIPPNLAARIAFTPTLPSGRAAAHAEWRMGATVKVIAVYPEPFWRRAGMSGELVATSGPVACAFDNTSADGTVASILAFVVGAEARGWSDRPYEERLQSVVRVLTRAYGPAAATPLELIEQDWEAEPFTGGCPVANPGLGNLVDHPGAVREPVGAIHWAGTETATEWTGYMEGAVQSGERAAAEVEAALSS